MGQHNNWTCLEDCEIIDQAPESGGLGSPGALPGTRLPLAILGLGPHESSARHRAPEEADPSSATRRSGGGVKTADPRSDGGADPSTCLHGTLPAAAETALHGALPVEL